MSLKYTLLAFLTSFTIYGNELLAQSPTSAAMKFGIFVKGDAVLKKHESEGPVAVGGNLTTNQYQISFDSKTGIYAVRNASIALAVGGAVKLNQGSLMVNNSHYVKIGNCLPSNSSQTNLKVWYRDENNAASTIQITQTGASSNSSPNIKINANLFTWTPNAGEANPGQTTNPVCENVFGKGADQIDMEGAFTKLTARSEQLSTLPDNLPILDQNGNVVKDAEMGPYTKPSVIGNNPKIYTNPNAINVLTVSAEVWNKIGNANVEINPVYRNAGQNSYGPNFGLIVNIINFQAFSAVKNALDFPQLGGVSSSMGNYILFNFPDATGTVTLSGKTEINGTILAPKAIVVKEGSNNINGQMIAQSFTHDGGEMHYYPFTPSIAEPVTKKITVSAQSECIKDAPYLTYSVTANFDTKGETAKIEWINAAGKVIQENNSQPLSASILFPGAAVSVQGVGIAWPGWEFTSGKWVQVADLYSSIRDPGAKMRLTVGTSETINISYPVSTITCNTSPVSTPLPVKLASFTAQNVHCNVQLKWKVTEAKNFSHFIVERSADARNFTPLSRINYNEQTKEYSYADSPYSVESAPAKHYYYRLKQVDTDNSSDYSVIRSVEAGQCESRLAVDFYPNPTQKELNVKSYSPVKMLEIITIDGKQVYRTLPSESLTELKVDVQSFSQGLYIVNIVNGEGRYSSKIFKK
jgi:choice-of-anchor A domain-containing protein